MSEPSDDDRATVLKKESLAELLDNAKQIALENIKLSASRDGLLAAAKEMMDCMRLVGLVERGSYAADTLQAAIAAVDEEPEA